MIAGVDRTDTAYVWPPTISRVEGRRTVYLDLNHWIGLAKAATGHRDGERYRIALESARHARNTRAIVFPISGTHYQEVAGIADPRQRRAIAQAMEELSGFSTLLCHYLVMRLELEAVLDDIGGPRPTPLRPLSLLGRGVGHAFGVSGQLTIKSVDGGDATENVRFRWPDGPEAFDRWLAEAQLQAERGILAGPTDGEVPELQSYGWDPTVAHRGQEQRAQQERALKQQLDADPRWRRGRLRDVVSARYLLIELMDPLREGLSERGLSLDDVLRDRDSARRFVDSMPSADVFVTLATAAHRNGELRWTPNDIFDIDALSVAVAYCDIVVTERHRHHVLRTSGVAARLGTQVLATLEELCNVL
jgi:hypothetical protein